VHLYGDSFVKKGDQLVKWPTRVTEELFYYFLLQDGNMCSKWRIIDDIWPNLDEKRALSNLYNTIYRMRQMFAELEVPIVIDRVNNGYLMKTNQLIDVEYDKNKEDNLLESKGYLWSYGFELK
jgi:two-component SAPR family response regulator